MFPILVWIIILGDPSPASAGSPNNLHCMKKGTHVFLINHPPPKLTPMPEGVPLVASLMLKSNTSVLIIYK